MRKKNRLNSLRITHHALHFTFHTSRAPLSDGYAQIAAVVHHLVPFLLVHGVDQRLPFNVVVQVLNKQTHGTFANVLRSTGGVRG